MRREPKRGRNKGAGLGSGADVVVARGAAADGVAVAVNTFPRGELAELFRR